MEEKKLIKIPTAYYIDLLNPTSNGKRDNERGKGEQGKILADVPVTQSVLPIALIGCNLSASVKC